MHRFFDTSCTYVTLVRHPVRRVLSLFYFLRRSWPDSEIGRMTLGEFLDRSPDAYTPNDQVCRIAGYAPDRQGPATEETLEQAKKNVDEHFAVCGLTERFDESLLLMKRRLGWSKPPFYVRSNTNAQRPRAAEVDDALIDRIRADHSLDLRLHAHVADQLETAIEDDDGFERDLRRFRTMNGVVQPLLSGPLRLFRAGRRTLLAR
nr:hypothetical protein [Salinibacter ruber]